LRFGERPYPATLSHMRNRSGPLSLRGGTNGLNNADAFGTDFVSKALVKAEAFCSGQASDRIKRGALRKRCKGQTGARRFHRHFGKGQGTGDHVPKAVGTRVRIRRFDGPGEIFANLRPEVRQNGGGDFDHRLLSFSVPLGSWMRLHWPGLRRA
jgi:hypothetical protein